MKIQSRIFVFAAGAVLVLGIPVASMIATVATAPSAQETATGRPVSAFAALTTGPTNLGNFYRQWEARYVKSGGDRAAVVGLGYVEGLSKEATRAIGRADLDLYAGTVRAEVEGLNLPVDLWLVDNEEGKSVTPQPGDRMVRLGRLEEEDGKRTVSATLGKDFFQGFELDLVIVTRAGQSPADSRILVGSRSVFERVHTRTRLAAAERQEGGDGLARLAGLLSPDNAEANQILVSHNLVSSLVDNGANLFFRGTFGGNGRTCGTCHRVEANQGIEADFIATLPANDPLFVAELPPSQGGVPGLERPLLMRNFGLILENVDGLDNPTVKFAMRGVPHSLSMATSIAAPADGKPQVERTGWSGDGAPGSGALRLFPVGAVTQHFTKSLNRVENVDFVLPTDAQLDAMEAFSLSSGRLNELNLATGVTLANANAENGRLVFLNQGKCGGCHGNAGAIASFAPGNRNFNTGTETVTNPAQAVETFPLDGGHGSAAAFNFDSNGDGILDSFGDGTFNTPPLIEAADTAPFFHNNIAATVEDAVAFYSTAAFNNSPSGPVVGGINLTAQQNSDVGDFLRVLNAAFNLAIAIQRNDAALTLENSSSSQTLSPQFLSGGMPINGKTQTVNTLLALSNTELADAVEVLSDKGLHPTAVNQILTAIDQNEEAIAETSSNRRKKAIQNARNNLASAKGSLGTGLNFTLGEGNLTF